MFLWEEQVHGKCFEQVKKLISEAPVLKYFDLKGDTELQGDAPQNGLGRCIMQGGQPIGFAS